MDWTSHDELTRESSEDPSPSDEAHYLGLVRMVSTALIARGRNGDTRQVTAAHLHFHVGATWPLITTRRMPWKSVVWELAWFLRGDTDTKFLDDRGVTFWRGNTTSEFLKSRGLDAPAGYVGRSYGYQWQQQLPGIIDELRREPTSRRLLVVAWQTCDLAGMALPPCHYSFQFVVRECDPVCRTYDLMDPAARHQRELSDGGPLVAQDSTAADSHVLDIVATMRSADIALGVPCNIASYALLLKMVATVVGMTPGDLYLNMSCCHLYCDHEQGVAVQLSREPMQPPTLDFTPEYKADLVARGFAAMQELTPDCLIIKGYQPHPRITMKMAV